MSWGDIFTSFLVPPLATLGWNMAFRMFGLGRFYLWPLGWLSSGAAILITGCARSDLIAIIGGGLNVLAAAAAWWWRRKRRKRAPRAYGAKSRARVAALVMKTREAGRPRRVLRPVPGGVG